MFKCSRSFKSILNYRKGGFLVRVDGDSQPIVERFAKCANQKSVREESRRYRTASGSDRPWVRSRPRLLSLSPAHAQAVGDDCVPRAGRYWSRFCNVWTYLGELFSTHNKIAEAVPSIVGSFVE